MSKPVALVTCSKYLQLSASDQILAASLNELGLDAVAVDWRDSAVRWERFGIAVVRSTWDYHLHPEQFCRWTERIERITKLINPAPLLRWNSNKRYLVDLQNRGIPQVPFLLVEPGADPPHDALEGWDCDVVVKPLVGASAWQIARITARSVEEALTPELRRTGYLIQPFIQEVKNGEYSLVFLDNRFSHAVLKKPGPGDFRSQREHGASHRVVKPDPSIIEEAAAILAVVPMRPVYARIDGVLQNGRFVLMEAELIEPELFFDSYAPGARTFARVLVKHASKNGAEDIPSAGLFRC